jgi:hypothetical protein
MQNSVTNYSHHAIVFLINVPCLCSDLFLLGDVWSRAEGAGGPAVKKEGIDSIEGRRHSMYKGPGVGGTLSIEKLKED